ncbi:MAG TPA: hypothetical protein VMS98_14730 [Thermoanaerobaculia bacterium]|nr:hypothetical protein [Thermoanaerobaculia bacterium]
MKKTAVSFALAALFATQAFAAYVVVLKDGTRYNAKTKWVTTGTKARITLQNGQVLLVNVSDIDVAKSEELSKLGLGDVHIIEQGQPAAPAPQQQPSLGDSVRLRPRGEFGGASAATSTARPAGTADSTAPVSDQLDARLKSTFSRAYENIGIYESSLSGTNRVVRAEVTADSEDKVFNAISATAFLIIRNAGLENVQIDMVELFMKTTNGGAAGRFQMTRADAETVNTKAMQLQDYFVRRVIY